MNFEEFLSNTETREHSHTWGQVQLISGGILEMEAQGTRFLAPPHLAIWVPPGIMHRSFNRRPLEYCSLNIAKQLTDKFPAKTCLIQVTPIVSAIIDDFRLRDINVATEESDKRLVQVSARSTGNQRNPTPFSTVIRSQVLSAYFGSCRRESNGYDELVRMGRKSAYHGANISQTLSE